MKVQFGDKFMGGRSEHPDYAAEGIDVHRFAGKWFEIAAFPAWFDKGYECARAEWIYMDDYFEVANDRRCDGTISIQAAAAYPVSGTDSQLRIRFIWPFRGDYWIAALDENQQYAMVGHPQKKYLWIISRTPHMDDNAFRLVLKHALDEA